MIFSSLAHAFMGKTITAVTVNMDVEDVADIVVFTIGDDEELITARASGAAQLGYVGGDTSVLLDCVVNQVIDNYIKKCGMFCTTQTLTTEKGQVVFYWYSKVFNTFDVELRTC